MITDSKFCITRLLFTLRQFKDIHIVTNITFALRKQKVQHRGCVQNIRRPMSSSEYSYIWIYSLTSNFNTQPEELDGFQVLQWEAWQPKCRILYRKECFFLSDTLLNQQLFTVTSISISRGKFLLPFFSNKINTVPEILNNFIYMV